MAAQLCSTFMDDAEDKMDSIATSYILIGGIVGFFLGFPLGYLACYVMVTKAIDALRTSGQQWRSAFLDLLKSRAK